MTTATRDPARQYIAPEIARPHVITLYNRFIYEYGHNHIMTGDRIMRRKGTGALYNKEKETAASWQAINATIGNNFDIGDVVLWPYPGNRSPNYGTVINVRPRISQEETGVYIWLIGFACNYGVMEAVLDRFVSNGGAIMAALENYQSLHQFGLEVAFVYVPMGHYWLDTPVYYRPTEGGGNE